MAGPDPLGIPETFLVNPVPGRLFVNVSQNGLVWLWGRQPSLAVAFDMTPEGARGIARALDEAAGRAEQVRARRDAEAALAAKGSKKPTRKAAPRQDARSRRTKAGGEPRGRES